MPDALKRVPASLLLTLTLVSVACRADDATRPDPRGEFAPELAISEQRGRPQIGEVAGSATEQLAKAGRGRTIRGAQDDMLRLEQVVPGFAGYYLDEADALILQITRREGGLEDALRRELSKTFSRSPNAAGRSLASQASVSEFRSAQFSLSQLVAWEWTALTKIREGVVTGAGVNIRRNCVTVTVASAAAIGPAMKELIDAGIPQGALNIEVEEARTLSGTWTDTYRPTRGGIRLAMTNPAWGAGNMFFQSHGFNVRLDAQPGQPTRFLTVSHGPNAYHETNGHTGALILQPDVWSLYIGTITTNPAWLTGAACTLNGQAFDFCTYSDAALGTFAPGVSGERKIGTSVTEGGNGKVGSQQINNWYPIYGVLAPEQVTTNPTGVHKSGYRTGTTTGALTEPFFSGTMQNMPWGPPANGQTRSLLLYGFARISAMGWGAGDSGAPVFVRSAACGVYCAIGMQSAGSGAAWNHTNTTNQSLWGICKDGANCRVYVSRWESIESDLGLGTLNPRTTP